ncbi:MAG: MAPEG family protein, partial [Janthinobacterium sp.]
LFAAAVLIAHVTAQESALTLYGAALYLAARVLYLPLYAFGVPVVRTLVWCVSIAGLLMLFWAILFAS